MGPDGLGHACDGDAKRSQALRIHLDLILFGEAAHACHFRDAGYRHQLITHVPVLERSKLGKVETVGFQRVLEYPSDTGRVRSKGWLDPRRQILTQTVHVFEDSRPRPVDVCAVFENHIDETEPKKRIATHHPRARDLEHLRGNRERHLVFDDLGRLIPEISLDDDLHI